MFGRRRTGAARAPARASDWRSFDRVAEAYERTRALAHAQPAADLVAALGTPSDGGLLDVGTGTGVLAVAASEAQWDPVFGVDRSVPMVLRAASQGARVVIADVVDLPFRDGRFGAVAAAFALHVFPRYDTALFDMLRVIRADGQFGSVTWASHPDEFARTWRAVAETFASKELLEDSRRRAAPWEDQFSDPSKLDETLRDVGLRDVRIERRAYRQSISIEDYLAGRETMALGRFLRSMLGEVLWERFRNQVEKEFRNRFPDPLGDSYEVLIAVGRKAGR
jgi:ubiquinone/menaquinone biosynthesis C-methylase UbiE